jgi:hypothetical protein
MDRPNNLMHVHSLMWYDGEPDWADIERIIRDRVVDRFPVFRRRPVEADGQWHWEDDPDFDLARHLHRSELADGSDVAQLREHVSRRFSAGFDHEHPLWEMEMVTGVTGLADAPVTVTFSRFHHSLADGIRLVQMMLSLCDAVDGGALPPTVGRRGGGNPLSAGLGVVRQGAA